MNPGIWVKDGMAVHDRVGLKGCRALSPESWVAAGVNCCAIANIPGPSPTRERRPSLLPAAVAHTVALRKYLVVQKQKSN